MKMLFFCALAAALLTTGAYADAVERVEVGILDCDVEGGTGFVFGSTRDLTCRFDPADEERSEGAYLGQIDRWGVDIGSTEKSTIKWLVFAPTNDEFQPGALAGNYVGVSGQATIGVGLGANALVGGSSETISLQPLSVQAQEGLNVAVGVAGLKLRAVAD